MEYRNKRTGVVITVSSKIDGGDWEPLNKEPKTAVIIEKSEAPKKTTRVKK